LTFYTVSFTSERNFKAIIPRLDKFLNLGINTLELIPVAQFPAKKTGVMMEYTTTLDLKVIAFLNLAHILPKNFTPIGEAGINFLKRKINR